MLRDEMIRRLVGMVASAKTARDVWDAFSLCGDWNSEHYDDGDEIFMQECDDGVAIEDEFVRIRWEEL